MKPVSQGERKAWKTPTLVQHGPVQELTGRDPVLGQFVRGASPLRGSLGGAVPS